MFVHFVHESVTRLGESKPEMDFAGWELDQGWPEQRCIIGKNLV